MLKGIGTDIIEVARIAASMERHPKFMEEVFSKKEQAYCQSFKGSTQNFAGRFAAKEAIVKALGTGMRNGISWLDMEIINDENGKPVAIFSDKLNHLFQYPKFHISISHCKEYATATAVWEE